MPAAVATARPHWVRRTAALLAAGSVAWVLLRNLDRIGLGIGLPCLAGLVAVVAWLSGRQSLERPPSRLEILLGSLFAAGLGLFFRLRHLRTVPIGYEPEPLNFLVFAQQLIDQGFPYVPYAWYAHTLWSYAIAGAMLLLDPLLALRVAAATLSLATLAALFFCLRTLANARAAWIGTALLAVSYWHLFATRNGLHQFLLPLFQLLVVGGLIHGIRTKQPWSFVLAAFAMALGLHSHWGFFLMPVFCLTVLLYLWAFDRESLVASRRGLALTLGLTGVLVAPLLLFYARNRSVFGYPFEAVKSTGGFLSKTAENLRFLFWTLSGNPNARDHAEHAPVLNLFVAVAALIGLAICLRQFAVSLSHAAPVQLLAVNVSGLAVTTGKHYYVVAVLAAVYWLAALGIESVVREGAAMGRGAAAILPLLVGGAIGWEAVSEYREFFGKRIFTDMTNPLGRAGSFYPVLDRVLRLSASRRVFLPRQEPGRDFDTAPLMLGEKLPVYAALANTSPFYANRPFFFASDLRGRGGAEVFLPNVPFLQRVALPILSRLHPRIGVEPIFSPEPYRARQEAAVAYRLSVATVEAMAYQGLRVHSLADGRKRAEGLFFAPEDGRYHFRSAEDIVELRLHGKPLDVSRRGEPSGAGQLLEGGVHPIQFVSRQGGETLEWRVREQAWSALGPLLLNLGDHKAEHFAPYLAALGRPASFSYERRMVVDSGTRLHNAVAREDGGIAAVSSNTLFLYDASGFREEEIALPGHGNYLAARRGGEVFALAPDGAAFFSREGGAAPLASAGCQPADVVEDGARTVVLCTDSSLRSGEGVWLNPERLKDGEGRPILAPTRLARVPTGFVVVDHLTSELFLYDSAGRLLRHRVLAGAYDEGDLAGDSEGNLYVETYDRDLKAYSSEGELLFHPQRDSPRLFPEGQASPAQIRRLSFGKGMAVALDKDDSRFLFVYERRPAHTSFEGRDR